MRNLLRGLRAIDVVAVAYTAAFFAWLAIRTPGTHFSQIVGASAFCPLGVAVAWACWKNASIPGLDRRSRAGWLLLAASSLALAISGSAWDAYLVIVGTHGSAYPAWIDVIESSQNALVIAAFVLLPGRRISGRERTRFRLDAGMVVVAGTLVALYFGGRIWFADPATRTLRNLMAGPASDWLVFVVGAVGALQKRDREARAAVTCQVLASTLYVVANYYYALAENGPHHYRAGDAVDGLWFAAWVLRWMAARWFCYGRTAIGAPGAATADRHDEFAGFAYVVVAGCFLLLTSQVLTDDWRSVPLLAGSTIALTGLMLARVFLESRENRRLLVELTNQEARIQSLVERSSDAVLIVDRSGAITFASSTTPIVFGRESPVAQGGRLVDAVREDDRALVEALLDGVAGSPRLLLHVRASGVEWRAIEAVWTDLRADEAVKGLVLNCRDITDRRELERQLRHAQKLDAVGQLAGGLAHDVNNALAIVGGYTELLRGELEPSSPAAEDLTKVQHAVDRAASITRKVLAFSRKQAAQPTVLDPAAVVRDLLPMLCQLATERVEVRTSLEAVSWPLRVDRGQLEQVLVNLVANARDAMPEGGLLEIVVSNREVRTVSASTAALPPGDYVSITVRDHGIGMTDAVRERIFEPFFTTKGGAGMGLGLAMVHGIVVASGGRIAVDSVPGEGSTFTILLPRTEAAGASVPLSADLRQPPAEGRTVLVVDDEENVRVVAHRMLERLGYQVIEASDGQQALDVIGDPAVRVDLLLTDLVMPGLHGRQVIARCETIRPALPIICMTGFAGEGDDPHQYGANLVALLSKPFSAAVLARAVGDALAKRSVS